MKRLLSLLLCLLLLSSLSVPAFAMSYSFKTPGGVKLAFPKKSAYLEEPFKARVLGCNGTADIYIMPKPEDGNGVLGTLVNDETVTILAEYGGFYFFQSDEGFYGWNGKDFFAPITEEASEEAAEQPAEEPVLPVSDTGETMVMPSEEDYLDTPRVKLVSVGSPDGKGAIYLMPMPEAGHGNIGKVKDTSTVLVLAEHQGFYFIQTVDGRQGWNGCGWFVD